MLASCRACCQCVAEQQWRRDDAHDHQERPVYEGGAAWAPSEGEADEASDRRSCPSQRDDSFADGTWDEGMAPPHLLARLACLCRVARVGWRRRAAERPPLPPDNLLFEHLAVDW